MESRKGLAAIGGAGALFIMQSNYIVARHGSRPPIQPFESPCLGRTVEDIYGSFKRGVVPQDYFTEHTFAIVDDETASTKTILVASDADGSLQTVRSDFWSSLHAMVPFEMKTITVQQSSAGGNGLISKELIKKQDADYDAMQKSQKAE
ncbi:MAG: hypothetical protein Q9187_002723 [Circinaria calcarea]